MIKLTINKIPIEIEDGLTVMQACQQAAYEIPHFCFHQRLNIAGNCRMCLVELISSPKLIASCSFPAENNMIIETNSIKVQKARAGVMEFLLINHPLDCPICDQGGECDLQDQSFKYGKGKSRYIENKRSVTEKYLGPLIKTHMTRCIHCTRCIRFASDVAGIDEIGAIGRGENMEIISYLNKSLTSELSGNLIDLCPVGALTSKPYSFTLRSWEVEKTESIDVMDAMGSNIRIDARDLEIMRIIPKLNEDINEEWISDKARFSYDGLKIQRLDQPYIKQGNKLEKSNWNQAINRIISTLELKDRKKIAALVGFTEPCESMFVLKKLLSHLGSKMIDSNLLGYHFDTTSRSNYLFNSSITGVNKSDLCLLIGTNLRKVAPILNAKIGIRVRSKQLTVAQIGLSKNQTYKIIELGSNTQILHQLLDQTHDFAINLQNAKYPMIIIGDGVLVRKDSDIIISLIHNIVKKYNIVRNDWNGFNIIHNHASSVGGLDLGCYYDKPGLGTEKILQKTHTGEVKILYLLGADDIDMSKISNNTFVIYQGHHGDAGANRADIILPSAAYTEQEGIYINFEGRPQYSRKAVPAPGIAKNSWKVICDIAHQLDFLKNIKTLTDVRNAMASECDIFTKMNQIAVQKFTPLHINGSLIKSDIKNIDTNYYMTDPITRASVIMAKCIQEHQSNP